MLTALRSRRQHPPDETGGALVMVLVFMIVISVVCTIVLNQEFSSFQAQSVASSERKVDISADQVIDTTIGSIRKQSNSHQGVDDGSSSAKCTHDATPNPTPDPSNLPAATDNHVVYSATVGSVPVKILCYPVPTSGRKTIDGVPIFNQTLITTGGLQGPGNVSGTSVDDYIPFCDDDANGSVCEAGVYIGRGASTTNDGFNVSNGSGVGPAIVSNSSIVVNSFQGPKRKLSVTGPTLQTISARRGCMTNTGTAGTYWEKTGSFQLNYDPTGTPGFDLNPPWSSLCWLSQSPFTSGSYTKPLTIEPISSFHHQLWDATASNCANPLPNPPEVAYDSAAAACEDLVGKNLLQLRTPPSTSQCATGLVTFEPGWYNDVDQLNAFLTGTCKNTVLWFKPGVYYFDFKSSGSGNYTWGGQNGPATGLQPAWIVAGNPPGLDGDNNSHNLSNWQKWTPQGCTLNGAAAPTCPQQPTKRMFPQSFQVSAQSQWDANYPAEAEKLDNHPATVLLAQTDTNSTATLTTQNYSTPLSDTIDPTSNKPLVTVDGLKVEFAYQLQVSSPELWSKRKVTVNIPNGSCTITLPASTNYTYTNPLIVDFTNGCPTTQNGISFGGTTTGTFASNTASPPNSASPQVLSPWTATRINSMTLQFQVQRARTSTYAPQLDGMQVDVDYHGPPSPSFTGGCDPYSSGVQWIFGGQSHIDFTNANLGGANNNTGVYFEMCAIRSGYGSAIYGLTDHPSESSPSATCCGTVGPPVYQDPPPDLPTVNTANFGNLPSGKTLADVLATNDGTMLDNTGNWTNDNNAVVTYKLPSNFLPPDASVERIEFDVTHAESNVKSIQLDIQPKTGSGGVGWNTDTVRWTALPADICRPNAKMPMTTDANQGSCMSAADSNGLKTWRYGLYLDRNDSSKVNDNWLSERQPMDRKYLGCDEISGSCSGASALTPALNGATVTYTVTPFAGSNPKWAKLDQIKIHVVYRPLGTLRPLTYCVALRPYGNWQYRAGFPMPYMAGTDRDFGANVKQSTIMSDDAYNTNSPSTSCALLRMVGPRFHVEGSLWAPSAAVDVTGNDNDANFLTNAMVARQFTATRWVNNQFQCGLGCTTVTLVHRMFKLLAYRTDTSTPSLMAEASIDIDDDNGNNVGKTVNVNWWLKRPGSS